MCISLGASSNVSLCPLLMSWLHLFIALLARNKSNNIGKITFKALIDFNISHDEFTLMNNEESNCFRLTESIRAKEIN